ncbi:MAG: DCC1-like thiol-disulfide oxidoreductase family protein [Isosphaeraceae bacterium]
MRRFLSDVAAYLGELGGAAHRGWNAFFFTPASPTSLGCLRVAVGLLAFWSLLVFGLDLRDYFGSNGWADPELMRSIQRPLAWSFWFSVSDVWLRPVWCLCLAVLALYTLGIMSRVTAVLSWVIVVSTARRAPIALFGFDQVLSMLTFYLAVTGTSGQAVSLDRFWRRWRQARSAIRARPALPQARGASRRVAPDDPAEPPLSISANLALRLIQLHLVVIYGMAGLSKLQGPSWWTGTALWRTMATGEFVGWDFTPLAAWPWAINFLTHLSLALELLYPVLIWVGIVRPLVLGGIVALHVGIGVISPGLMEFALIMIAANLVFVRGGWLRGLVTGRYQPELRVLFDGACPRCRSSMALLTAADPSHVLDPVDLTAVDVGSIDPRLTRDDCMRSMHVISRTGRITAGFDAVRTLAAWLPLFWPAAVVGFFPGVAWAGRRVYNMVAAARPRDVACTDLACGIHSRPSHRLALDRGQAQNSQNAIATLLDTEETVQS